ncbi:MAG: carboxypeptidase-like regulatory domain-containing protein, partial [Dysgonomonas mossii]|nr:carboxypeptidase-like regulatory domain-containing protein [Dysgonomonas mossii]
MTLMKFILGGKSKYLLFLGLFLMSFTVQSKRIDSISINRTGAIRSVLKEIEKASSYHFMYNDKLINTDKIVSINVKDRPVNEILNSLFEDSNITYTIVDDQIILSVAGTNEVKDSRQSTQPIKGTIKDATTNEPMIGVSVVEKGTTNGTITDIDGAYTLSVKENSTLIFSFLGYKQQSIAIGNRSTIDVLLEEDVHQLSEVVAIGYGSARKQDLSMAVSTIQIDESMKSRPSDFNTLLQGRVSGLTIQSAGGDPLKAGTISIRGRGSRGNDGDPSSGDGILYVVDGVPNAPFNMADVESVTVLKDAASAAIYGASVGSGGVIIITTKQAQAGKAKVSLNIYQGIQNVSKIPDVLSAEQYNQVWAKAIADKSP